MGELAAWSPTPPPLPKSSPESITNSISCTPRELSSIGMSGEVWKKESSLATKRGRKTTVYFLEIVFESQSRPSYMPSPVAALVACELVCTLCCRHGVWQILLVREYKKDGITELIHGEHTVQLITGLINTIAIITVHHKNDTLCVCVVMPPQWTDLVLTANVPHGERNVLVLYGLHVETDGWDGGHHLSELELVKNGSLTSGVKTNHKDTTILFADEPCENLTEDTHCLSSIPHVLCVAT